MRALYVPKGTRWDETTSNNERIKPAALAIIELHLSEGRQADRQAVGLRQLCRHNFEHNGLAKASSIMPA